MASRRRLIVVSNRGPVGYARGPDGERVARRGGGGLVTALRSLVAAVHAEEDMVRRLPGFDRPLTDPHAAADVQQHGELHGPVHFGTEIENRTGLPRLDDLKILFGEVLDEPPLAILHHGRDRHEVDR